MNSAVMTTWLAACWTVPIIPVIDTKTRNPTRIRMFWNETGTEILTICRSVSALSLSRA